MALRLVMCFPLLWMALIVVLYEAAKTRFGLHKLRNVQVTTAALLPAVVKIDGGWVLFLNDANALNPSHVVKIMFVNRSSIRMSSGVPVSLRNVQLTMALHFSAVVNKERVPSGTVLKINALVQSQPV